MRATGPSQPGQLLIDIIDILKALEIPYAVIGAFAVACYGVPRYTNDGDGVIWTGPSGKTIEDLRGQLIASGYRAEVRRGDFEDPILETIRIDDSFNNRIDLLSSIRGMDPEAVSRCVAAPILDSSVRIIAAEDLIGMKLFAGGPQDLVDVQGILQVWKERLDPVLLHKVAHRYGADVAEALDQFLEKFPL